MKTIKSKSATRIWYILISLQRYLGEDVRVISEAIWLTQAMVIRESKIALVQLFERLEVR